MAANPAVPFHDEGNTLTCQAEAAIGGKRFVRVSASGTFDDVPIVNLTTAGGPALGVSGYDAAAGAQLTVYSAAGIVMPVVAGAAITAGQEVQADAAGAAIPLAAGKRLGLALKDAASGSDAKIKLGL